MSDPIHVSGTIGAPGYTSQAFAFDLQPTGNPVPPIPVPPTGSDMIDLSHALIVNAPDVRGWPITTAISRISFDGIKSRIVFAKQDEPNRWPDVLPPGFTGPIQYTWWLFRYVGDQWVGSAFLEMWYGRDGSGGVGDPDLPSLYDQHWYYSSRWAPLYGSGRIHPGEVIGMMVTSGDARDSKGPYSVSERSNVVTFAATDNGSYLF